MTRLVRTIVMLVLTLAATGSLEAGQGRGPGRGGPGNPPDGGAAPPVSPAEIQRMFDAYALLQAQEQLRVSDEQYPQFLSRFKALQDVRRRALQEHARAVQELRRMLADTPTDEAQLRERLKGLNEGDARAASDVRRAYESLDQFLDVAQQARFRVFEQQMEQRKLELVTRARLANRARQP